MVLKALVSAAKVYAIHHLDIRYMLRTPTKYIFILYVTLYLEKGSVFLTVSISKVFGRPRIVSLMIISQELIPGKLNSAVSAFISLIKPHETLASSIV